MCVPDRKKYSLWKINIFVKTAVFNICVPKSLNMCSEWRNIKECNKYPRAIQNICVRGGQKWNSFLFCSNSQHYRSQLLVMYQNASSWHDLVSFQHELLIFFYDVAALIHLARHWLTELCLHLCLHFTYYQANRQMLSYSLNNIFKLK